MKRPKKWNLKTLEGLKKDAIEVVEIQKKMLKYTERLEEMKQEDNWTNYLSDDFNDAFNDNERMEMYVYMQIIAAGKNIDFIASNPSIAEDFEEYTDHSVKSLLY